MELNKLKKNMTYPPDGWDRISKLWNNNSPVSFYSWECPPRQIQENKKYGRWINFDIDIESVISGKKIDNYTELPRLTSQPEKELWFIKEVVQKNSKASYIKIIADTNGLYLFVKTKNILGNKKIRDLSNKFRDLLTKKAKELLGQFSPEIILFTKIQKPFKKEYEMFFNLIYQSFNTVTKSSFVTQEILDAWMDCMINHIGLTSKDKKERVDVLKRVIASYAAEGMLFELANRFGEMPNPVWINWEEKPELAKTTNILRQRYGLENIPTIYFVRN
ncbi:hypothetical protein A2961_04515 [Candidatus Woesebacteria bacterium RIFCSPLOWO2_01_FULL_39_21]|uniref:Uncharacterized protein n=1 Tax=Candidatus Woesebacteria bacterium RIFCSPLOWO2_01_FULL_39_21 TaxID=1802519 RepID=A0A1F8BHU0_9BACT|nr:MAG: hypothetical protein A2961_04515 [Candidatus Woesebacteria bacterium RIFCSPLOWO2_01_FULL_39_21]